MKNYRVQRMTNENYTKYMSGAMFYDVEILNISANSKEEAIQKAQAPNYYVNDSYVITQEEYEQQQAQLQQRIIEEQEKAQRQKEKRLQTQQRKAQEMGLSVEEYKKYINLKRNKTQCEKRIKELLNEIENEKMKLKYYEEQLNQF